MNRNRWNLQNTQYDVDTETVIGFLKAHNLDKDFKVNIEVNHATLAGHTFEHELAVAVDNGMLGSIDANRGDYQNGWDTDQFPIDNFELTQAMMQIIRNGGFGNGGTNFDAKTRRNSTDLEDIFIAHIAGMDVMARALESAAKLLEESPYKKMLADRKDDMGMMIELVVDEETLMARLLNRAIEQGRADDNEETIKKRFEVYRNQTAPLAEWFEKEGLRHTFNWKGSKEQMLAEIFEAIDAANK